MIGAFFVDNCVDMLFSNCKAFNNTGSGIEITNNSNNISIDACSMSCNKINGYEINTNSAYITISDGSCSQNMLYGAHIDSSVSDIIINSSCFLYNSKGIYVEGTENVISASSVCSNNTGIECIGSIIIKGCTIHSNTTNGIDLTSGHDSVIESNQLHNNGNTGIIIGGENNIISTNRIRSCVNGVQINITAGNTIVTSNNMKGNTGTNYSDLGTGTISANNIII